MCLTNAARDMQSKLRRLQPAFTGFVLEVFAGAWGNLPQAQRLKIFEKECPHVAVQTAIRITLGPNRRPGSPACNRHLDYSI